MPGGRRFERSWVVVGFNNVHEVDYAKLITAADETDRRARRRNENRKLNNFKCNDEVVVRAWRRRGTQRNRDTGVWSKPSLLYRRSNSKKKV